MLKPRLDIIRQYPLICCLAFALILLAGAGLTALVQWDYRISQRANLAAYQSSSTADLTLAGDIIENTFADIYHNLRTIARLPGVRGFDPHAGKKLTFHGGLGIEENTRLSAQELYNSLATSVSVSELYIVPINFDPDADASDPDYFCEPLATFDQLIINRTAEDSTDLTPDVQEIEIYEYRLMRKQLAWFKEHFPHHMAITDLNNYPAITGPEVVTCDNTRYSPSNPNDKDRSGVVISVPFYGLDGDLQGCVSAVILTHALSDLLPDDHYAIVNPDYDYFVPQSKDGQPYASKPHSTKAKPDPGLIFSEVDGLQTHDMGGDWFVWAGRPDAAFWSRGDVMNTIQARNINYGFALILTLLAIPSAWLIIRGQRNTALTNQSLEVKVNEQTAELQNVIDAHDRHISAIDQHALVLTADVQGNITEANAMLCQASGYAKDELIGQHWKILESRDMRKSLRHQIWGALAQGQTWQGELQQRAKDGCHYWVQNTTVPIKDDTGALTHFITVQTDINEYKRIQSQLIRDETGTKLTG